MSKELAASGQLSAEQIEMHRRRLNVVQSLGVIFPPGSDVLCDMALRSLTAPTNTPNGDRQELIDKCLDAGRDEGIEAAAKILHEPWASAVRALAQDQRSEAPK